MELVFIMFSVCSLFMSIGSLALIVPTIFDIRNIKNEINGIRSLLINKTN